MLVKKFGAVPFPSLGLLFAHLASMLSRSASDFLQIYSPTCGQTHKAHLFDLNARSDCAKKGVASSMYCKL